MTNPLALIERTNLILAVGAIVVGEMVWGDEGAVAVAAGAVVACANLWALRRFAMRAVSRVLSGDPAGTMGAGFLFKMPLLLAVLWIAIVVVRLPVAPFTLGLSIVLPSLIGGGAYLALRQEAV